MRYSNIVKERLIDIIKPVDSNLAMQIDGIVMGLHGLERTTAIVNDVLKNYLFEQTSDSKLRRRGSYVLCVPEEYDALPYWIDGISNDYVPALQQARSIRESEPIPSKES